MDIVRQSLYEYLLQGISDALDEGIRAWQALKAGIAIDTVESCSGASKLQ